MTTVFVTYDEAQQRHYLIGVAKDGEYSSQIEGGDWNGARAAIKIALAEGVLLTARGDRYVHGAVAVVVDSTRLKNS